MIAYKRYRITKLTIYQTVGNGLQCYYCSHDSTCNADEPGELVECQMNDPRERHYGDACEVAHTGKNMGFSIFKRILN